MSSFTRKQAIASIAAGSTEKQLSIGEVNITELYGDDVLSLRVIKKYLAVDVFEKLEEIKGTGLYNSLADVCDKLDNLD